MQSSSTPPNYTVDIEKDQQYANLEFNLDNRDILEQFGKFFDDTVNSLNGFYLPKFSKVVELTEDEYKKEYEELRK
jgi:hypothetical protein